MYLPIAMNLLNDIVAPPFVSRGGGRFASKEGCVIEIPFECNECVPRARGLSVTEDVDKWMTINSD